jgi:hypothetical protein
MSMEDLESISESVFSKGGSIFLLEADVDSVTRSSAKILKTLIGPKGRPGIVIATNKPYTKIREELVAEQVEAKELYFVDMISSSKDSVQEDGKVVLLRSPESLTECSITVTGLLDKIPVGESFVFMDSVSTLLIYNSESSVAKFIHHLTIRMRMKGIGGIFCLVQGQVDLHLHAQIGQLFDRVIGLKGP